MNIPEIQTERLLLRGFTEDDLDGLGGDLRDPEVTRWVGDDDGLSREDAWRRMAYFNGHWALRGFGQLGARGARHRRAGRPRRPATGPRPGPAWRSAGSWDASTGAAASRPRPAGRRWSGRATELGADHIISLIEDDNERSARVAEKLGMTVEGRTRIVNGEYEVRIFGADLGTSDS